MKAIVRGGFVAALALAVTATSFASNAEAYRRRGAGIAIGALAIGALVAGAAAAHSRERVYVRSSGCSDYRRRAIWNEDNGNHRAARYWWNRFEDCRND